jgi:hypothetical protein
VVESARTGGQRQADTLAKLEAIHADVWVATASADGTAHLIPLSYAWDGESVVLAAPPTSLTMRNIRSSGQVRLGFGPTRDVVLIDAELIRLIGSGDDSWSETARAYVEQATWDPRNEAEPYVFAILRPRRIQAWRESNELPGKLIMRDGEWLY